MKEGAPAPGRSRHRFLTHGQPPSCTRWVSPRVLLAKCVRFGRWMFVMGHSGGMPGSRKARFDARWVSAYPEQPGRGRQKWSLSCFGRPLLENCNVDTAKGGLLGSLPSQPGVLGPDVAPSHAPQNCPAEILDLQLPCKIQISSSSDGRASVLSPTLLDSCMPG